MSRPRRRPRLAWLAAAAAPLVALGAWIAWPLPPALLDARRGDGVVLEDRNGLPLRAARAADGTRARWVPYDRIDPDLINAFVAVEDRRFWEHPGVDPLALARAVRSNLRARRVVSGASTITMQLARLLRPADRDWGGKLTQALWALRIERHLDKQRILEQYLNRVQLGQATAGVAAASALYFGAAPGELGVGQAALLAGIAHAPSRDNPFASPPRARARRALALERMRRLGHVMREEVARARDEPLAGGTRAAPFLAPHFSARALAWSGGTASRVRTSLDLPLQEALEGEVRHTVDVLRGRGVEHAAAVVLDNESGEVLAWVGSPDFWAPDGGQTDMVDSPRQPGSALKPFLYALAFDRGYTAASVLPDVPKSYATATGAYRPRNYDRRFRGPVRAREALASSYNVPAVELADRLGAGALLHTLRLAGFASLRRGAEHYGLGLALGNGDVTLIELANGYRALANGGAWRPWTWRASPAGARTVAPGDERRVVSPRASALVLDILRDPAARIPGFGADTPFDFPFPVAVKTGTSRHFTDNWAVGATRRFTVAVWAGNFGGRPMEGVSGITGAGPLLHRAVLAVARRLEPGALPTPAELGAIPVPVCRLSGLRATASCASLGEWFAPGTEPSRADDWEVAGRVTLPDEYAEWARVGLRTAPSDAPVGGLAAQLATATRPAPVPNAPAPAARAARFRIVSPLDGDRYAVPPGVVGRFSTISLRAAGPGAERVRWSVDGAPHDGERWPLQPGGHVVRAVSARGDSVEVRITVER
jgi:penicillin-binding protein 1C